MDLRLNASQAKELKPGDIIKSHDPDEGICSRLIQVSEVQFKNRNNITILGIDGSETQVLPWELEPLTDSHVQLLRLLDEGFAVISEAQVAEMAESMNMSADDVRALLESASDGWEVCNPR